MVVLLQSLCGTSDTLRLEFKVVSRPPFCRFEKGNKKVKSTWSYLSGLLSVVGKYPLRMNYSNLTAFTKLRHPLQ